MKDKIEEFLDAIEDTFADFDPRTQWPLNAGQMDAYFDVAEALDIYWRLNKLRKELTVEEIAKILPPPDVIRLSLLHNALIGLKVADKLGIEKISCDNRAKYANFLFEILGQKVQNNIFCQDGKNLILTSRQLSSLVDETRWDVPSDNQEKRNLSFLNISANNYCYTLYFDAYMSGGFYLHGPYDVEDKFGKGAILLVREYHDICPTELWPGLKLPHKTMRISAVYQNLSLRINLSSHPISNDSIGDKLIAYSVILDGKVLEPADLPALDVRFEKLAQAQSKEVNDLDVLDKVRKGAEISYYLFKDLRKYMGDDWRPLRYLEENIKDFGDRFVHHFKYEKVPNLVHWRKIFDPRNDYY